MKDFASIEDVLSFWFGEDESAAERSAQWFAVDPDFDAELRRRFDRTRNAAIEAKLRDWESSPRGALALIILLDQFSRNIDRGKADAFAHDPAARQLSIDLIENGWDRRLTTLQRVFAYMPLMHSEDLSDQEMCVKQLAALEESCEPSLAERVANSRNFASEHLLIIQSFGRFPHRNLILGRVSTSEEIDFLENDADDYGQNRMVEQ